MNRTRVMRYALWTTAFFNFGAALLFIFPDSLGQLAAMPLPVHRYYTSVLALFVGGLGGAYAWLACQARIDRPLVVLAAIGKMGVFAITLGFWLFADGAARGVWVATGDLAFAAIFVWWLLGEEPAPPWTATQPGVDAAARGG